VRKSDGAVLEARCATGGPPSGVEPFLAQIASLAVGAERHAGVPQDIEWAVSATSLYLLQARPITRLPAEPVSFEDAMRPLYGHTVRLRELVPTAMTPLGADVTVRAFALMGEGMVTQGLVSPRFADRFAALARAFQGRVYNDMTLLRDGMAPLADEVAVLDFVEGGPWPRPRRDRWRAIGLEIPRLARLPRILSYLRHFDRHAADAIAGFEQSIAPLEREPLHTWSRERLLDLLRGEPSPAYRRAFAGVLCANGLAGTDAEIAFTTASRMVTAWAGEPATTTAKLACGLPGIGDVECVATLWALARTARGIPELRRALQADPGSALGAAADQPAWREAFEAFLVRYGHRGIEELDVARPRWRDQPAFVLSVIANYVENGDETANPEGVHRRLAAEREAIEQRISRRLGRSPLRRWLVREVIAMLQKLTVVRQNTKSAYIRGFDLSRRAALELGRRLVEQDRLDRVEDCFFLELADLEQPRDFRGLVAERRRTHAAWQREVPPRFVDARGRPVHVAAARTVTDAATGADTLTGIGSSPGIARGPVRIVRDPSAGVRLAPGHVLVAPYTDPAWTPLFASVAAVVVEVGSVLSHASIVARELGIPSVVAVAAATAKLRDGDIVEVDGHAGTVRSAGR
jgi:pyruvate,water dikinase